MLCCYRLREMEEEAGRKVEGPRDGVVEGWSMATPRIFTLLASCKSVLIAGCGGGYDVLSGLPLLFHLRAQGKRVNLASLSFTDLPRLAKGAEYCDMCYKVTSRFPPPKGTQPYFPEYYLSCWFKRKFGEDVPLYSFNRMTGVAQLRAAYEKIVGELGVDAVVLVDGGTDSLMFGEEQSMGTPMEDQTSITAVGSLDNVATKLLLCVGFGVDSFHGVSHGLFLENVAFLERKGAYLGTFSIPQGSTEGALYMEGYRAVAEQMQPSIVCSSITDAMQGHFGNYHSTKRTGNSTLFINPLMALCWCFQLEAVVQSIPYSEQLLNTLTCFEVDSIINKHHGQLANKGALRKPIPLPM